jgi:hypothetical protein
VVAVAAAMLVPFVLASSGDIGFQGAAGAGRYTSVFGRWIDPTVSFRHAREVAHHRDGHWYMAPRQLVELYGESLIGTRSLIVLGLFALAAVVVAVLLLLRVRDDVGVLGVVTTGLMATFVVVALAFSWRYSTFIPAMFGRRRLFDYAVIAAALMGVVLAELGCRQLWRLRPWAPLAGASSLVAVAAIVALPQTHPSGQNVTASERGLQALTWINSHIECDARILSSRRTAGSFETLTGRASIDEGMAPYLRPTILRPVLQNLIDIRRFFTDPAANSEFLRQHAVDYVIVFDNDLAIGDVPSGISSHVNVDALAAAPFLHEVANDAGMRVFQVTSAAAAPGAALRPSGFSAYTCKRGEAG